MLKNKGSLPSKSAKGSSTKKEPNKSLKQAANKLVTPNFTEPVMPLGRYKGSASILTHDNSTVLVKPHQATVAKDWIKTVRDLSTKQIEKKLKKENYNPLEFSWNK